MSHHDTHDAPPHFPAEEWAEFKKDDIAAGKAVILLMTGIFLIGIVIYTFVNLAVAH